MSDTKNTLIVMAGICMNSLPSPPGTKNMGAKATMFVVTAKKPFALS